jgi:hypothetical protein
MMCFAGGANSRAAPHRQRGVWLEKLQLVPLDTVPCIHMPGAAGLLFHSPLPCRHFPQRVVRAVQMHMLPLTDSAGVWLQ